MALRIPDLDKPFVVVTDSSDTGVGAMLAQKGEEEVLIPVAFYYHSMTEAEVKYNTTEKELLAVVMACKKFRIYLGKPFDLITDHSALKWLFTMNVDDTRGRRARWIDFLQQFPMNTVHKSSRSKELSMADYLSRVTPSGDIDSTGSIAVIKMRIATDEIFVNNSFDVKELQEGQMKDEEVQERIKQINEGLLQGQCKGEPSDDRFLIDSRGLLRLRYNCGRKTVEHPHGKSEIHRIVIPKCCVDKVLELVHDNPLAGHMGHRRTWIRARNCFWWPRMKQEIHEYINNCEKCRRNKHDTGGKESSLSGD